MSANNEVRRGDAPENRAVLGSGARAAEADAKAGQVVGASTQQQHFSSEALHSRAAAPTY